MKYFSLIVLLYIYSCNTVSSKKTTSYCHFYISSIPLLDTNKKVVYIHDTVTIFRNGRYSIIRRYVQESFFVEGIKGATYNNTAIFQLFKNGAKKGISNGGRDYEMVQFNVDSVLKEHPALNIDPHYDDDILYTSFLKNDEMVKKYTNNRSKTDLSFPDTTVLFLKKQLANDTFSLSNIFDSSYYKLRKIVYHYNPNKVYGKLVIKQARELIFELKKAEEKEVKLFLPILEKYLLYCKENKIVLD
jgi:hypothetical protein